MNVWLIATLGWRAALAAFGCIVATAAVSLALLYRDPPVDREHLVAGAATAQGGSIRSTDEVWTLRRALHSTQLWAAFTMTALGVIGYQIMATHQVAHAVDRGFHQATVVWLFAFGAGCTMVGNLLGGWLSDQLGRGWVLVLGSIIAIAGIGCLAMIRGPHNLVLLGRIFDRCAGGAGFARSPTSSMRTARRRPRPAVTRGRAGGRPRACASCSWIACSTGRC